jgi:phosphoribosylformylglycinamidine synthase
MVLKWNGETAADIPLAPLADDAPCYSRPWVKTEPPAPLTDVPESSDIAADLLKLMASPDIASRRWIYQQYDQKVGGDTVQAPGGDAAVVRVHGSKKALAITTDCTPRYCKADPYEGGKQAIAEAWRNLCAVGARPLAATDCMNFGNPQRPEIMGQFVGCIEGLAEACAALDFPIVSGNVSLYNETRNEDGSSQAILPTPAIGGVGLIDDWARAATIAFKAEGEWILLLGGDGTHLGQSIWLRELHGREDGPPPPVDLTQERRIGETVRRLIDEGAVSAVHDVADGGVAAAVAEMALASGIGARLASNVGDHQAALWFGEDQGRYLVTTADRKLHETLRAGGVHAIVLGETGGLDHQNGEQHLVFEQHVPLALASSTDLSLRQLRDAHEGFLPDLMGADGALA